MPDLTLASRTIRRAVVAMAAAALSLAVVTPVRAATCSLSANALAFGNYNGVTKAAVNITTTFTQTCSGSGTVTYSISANGGQSNNVAARALASGGNRLNYQVYTNSGRTTVFGGSGGTFTGSNLSPAAASRSFTLYGTVAAGQAAVPGTYSDSVTITVTY